MAMDWLGMGMTLPVGVFLQRYGVHAGSLLAMTLSGGAYLLIWSACNNVAFYHNWYGLLAFFFFLAGKSIRPVYSVFYHDLHFCCHVS